MPQHLQLSKIVPQRNVCGCEEKRRGGEGRGKEGRRRERTKEKKEKGEGKKGRREGGKEEERNKLLMILFHLLNL